MGFPIRKFTDQSFFAAPRDLSQRSTSFIASQRQGIHRMPLRHLIALIINAHPTRQQDEHFFGQSSSSLSEKRNDRKTSFASQDRTDSASSRLASADPKACKPKRKSPLTMSRRLPPSPCGERRTTTRQDVGCRKLLRQHMYVTRMISHARTPGTIPSSRCQTTRARSMLRPTRISVLMDEFCFRRLVEPVGIEPTTSCLQSTRSPS